jgi:hypothetical protein
MTNKGWDEDAMERSITRALEERREVAVPEGFAALVRAGLPVKPRVRRRTSVGKTVAIVMVVLMMSAMFGLAPHAATGFSNLAFDVECVLMLQLAGIMCWLALRHES